MVTWDCIDVIRYTTNVDKYHSMVTKGMLEDFWKNSITKIQKNVLWFYSRQHHLGEI